MTEQKSALRAHKRTETTARANGFADVHLLRKLGTPPLRDSASQQLRTVAVFCQQPNHINRSHLGRRITNRLTTPVCVFLEIVVKHGSKLLGFGKVSILGLARGGPR